jgi:two-component system chemotaxis response regulator CheY
MKVLVVDDSKIARMTLAKNLAEFGLEVIGEAQNGKEGYEKYKELKPDVVFSDMEMPEIDGLGMLKLIKAYDKDAKVVMVTSVLNAQVIQTLISAGAFDCLKKPITKNIIEKLVSKI